MGFPKGSVFLIRSEPFGKPRERTCSILKLKHGKRIWPLLLAALLFFIGVASIIYPFFSNLMSVMTADTVISDYKDEVKDMSNDDIEDLMKEAHMFNKKL